MAIGLKRAYHPPSPRDGLRVLVDRLWPRGVPRDKAQIHEWLRDLSPSNDLRKWFHARPAQWLQFRRRYLHELSDPEALAALERLYQLAHRRSRLTLVFSSRNEEHNNAVVLKELLDGMRKPPSSTGPERAAAQASARRAPRPR